MAQPPLSPRPLHVPSSPPSWYSAMFGPNSSHRFRRPRSIQLRASSTGPDVGMHWHACEEFARPSFPDATSATQQTLNPNAEPGLPARLQESAPEATIVGQAWPSGQICPMSGTHAEIGRHLVDLGPIWAEFARVWPTHSRTCLELVGCGPKPGEIDPKLVDSGPHSPKMTQMRKVFSTLGFGRKAVAPDGTTKYRTVSSLHLCLLKQRVSSPGLTKSAPAVMARRGARCYATPRPPRPRCCHGPKYQD